MNPIINENNFLNIQLPTEVFKSVKNHKTTKDYWQTSYNIDELSGEIEKYFHWNYAKSRTDSLKFIKNTFKVLWNTKLPSHDFYFPPGSYHEALPEMIYLFYDDSFNEPKIISKTNDDNFMGLFFTNHLTTELREANTAEFVLAHPTKELKCPLARGIYRTCSDCDNFTNGYGKSVIGEIEEKIQQNLCPLNR